MGITSSSNGFLNVIAAFLWPLVVVAIGYVLVWSLTKKRKPVRRTQNYTNPNGEQQPKE